MSLLDEDEMGEDLQDLPPPVLSEKRKNGLKKKPTAVEQLANDSEDAILNYINELGGSAEYAIKLYRQDPMMFNGRQVGGFINEFPNFITDSEIKARYGGGRFKIQIHYKAPNGKMLFGPSRTFQISGDPVLSGSEGQPQVVQAQDINKDVLHALQKSQEQAAVRAERAEAELREALQRPQVSNGPDANELIRTTMAPLVAQLEAANKLNAELQRQLATPREDTTANKMLEKMVDGESARITVLRENHASELRQLRESGREDLKREADRADRMVQTMKETHTREIESIRFSMSSALETQKMAYEGRIASLNADIARLTTELHDIKKDLKDEREKKTESLEDNIIKMAQIKEALGAFGGDGDGEAKGTIEKLFDKASPLLEAVAARVMTQQQPQDQQMALAQAAQAQAIAQHQRQQALQQRSQVAAKVKKKKKTAIKVDPTNVALAVEFLESAYRSGTEPAKVAQSIVSVTPADVVAKIREIGIDAFLDEFTSVNPNSPIGTLAGRNFLRNVAKILIDGEQPPESPISQ